MRAAQRSIQGDESLQMVEQDQEWLRQAVRGFINLLLEAASGSGTEVRDTFFATVVPGLLADGQAPAPLFRSSSKFLALLGGQIFMETPPSEQSDVIVWFAEFKGSYMEALFLACQETEAP